MRKDRQAPQDRRARQDRQAQQDRQDPQDRQGPKDRQGGDAMPAPTATPVPPTATPEPPKAMFMTPDELIPEGLEQAHPLIYQYHWSRLAPPAAGPPDTGGTMRLSISFEPNNWSSLEGNFGTLIYGTLVYNGLVRADMRLSEALKGNDNLRALVVACDLCESFEVKSPSQYVFNLREGAQWHQTDPLNGRPITAADVKSSL